jgi:hypothetical protein
VNSNLMFFQVARSLDPQTVLADFYRTGHRHESTERCQEIYASFAALGEDPRRYPIPEEALIRLELLVS